MPVTTRLQERRRALEATDIASSPAPQDSRPNIRSAAPSPVASSSPSTIHSSPPARLPRRVSPLVNIHGRRSLLRTLHHFRGDISTTAFPDFPHISPLYAPEIKNEEPDTGVSDVACFASESENRGEELPDYVSDSETGYEYPSPPGVSPVAARSSSIAGECKEAVDIRDHRRGIKRKPSDHGLLTGVERFLDNIPIGKVTTTREMIDPSLRSPSFGRFTFQPLIPAALPPLAKKPKMQQLDEVPMHPRAKRILQRLQASYIATQDSQIVVVPSLSPVVELPRKNCHFYNVASNAWPADPHWVPEWPIHATWPGSLSPKLSPTGDGTTLYAAGCEGKKRKFEDVKSRMRIENVLNPEPEREAKRAKLDPESASAMMAARLPSFKEVVTGIEWQRLHDQHGEGVRRGDV